MRDVNGARMFGFVSGNVGDEVRERTCGIGGKRSKRVGVGVVRIRAGPKDRSVDVEWILSARKRGALPLLIVQAC